MTSSITDCLNEPISHISMKFASLFLSNKNILCIVFADDRIGASGLTPKSRISPPDLRSFWRHSRFDMPLSKRDKLLVDLQSLETKLHSLHARQKISLDKKPMPNNGKNTPTPLCVTAIYIYIQHCRRQ